jgi:hypothetical protein
MFALTGFLAAAGVTGLLTAGGVLVSAKRHEKEAREVMKNTIMAAIAAEDARVSEISDTSVSGALRDELAAVRDAAEIRLNDDDMTRLFNEIEAISIKIRRAEVDEMQCREREESVLSRIASIRSSADVPTGMELERLSKEVERARGMPAEDRMAILREIMHRFIEIKENSNEKFMSGVSEIFYEYNPRPAGENELLIAGIRDLADRIARHDEIEGERLLPVLEKLDSDTRFPGRLKTLHRQLKTLWGNVRERAASTSYFRETLRKLKDDLSAAHGVMASARGTELIGRCDTLIGAKFIERPSFMKLYEDMAKFVYEHAEEITGSMFTGKVKSALESLGYEIVGDGIPLDGRAGEHGAALSEPGDVSYLDSPYEGYRVMLKADKNGSLAARLVRIEDTADEASRDAGEQEQLDLETGRKWCGDFDAFMEKMRDMGLPMDVTLRQEPGDVKLMTIAGKDAKRSGRGRKKTSGRSGENRMMSARGDK